MKESEVIQLLQHYRHDLLNQLQLVQGYLSMDKKNKVEEKLDELFFSFNEERKLTSLKAPKFALWLLQFNHVYKNFRITYKINLESFSLETQDELLTMKCQDIMDICEKLSDKHVLYDVELILQSNHKLSITIHGIKNIIHSLDRNVKNKFDHVIEKEDGVVFQFEF